MALNRKTKKKIFSSIYINKYNGRKITPTLLILQSPLVLLHERVDHFLHAEIRNELIRRKRCSGDRVEMTDALQMLLDVLALVCDARRGDDGILQNLEGNLAANEVGNFALASPIVDFREQTIQFGCVILLKVGKEDD